MKNKKILIPLLLGGLLMAASCQSEASKKAEKVKADSLEIQTQNAADSAQKALDEYMNSVDESTITNDSPDIKKPKN